MPQEPRYLHAATDQHRKTNVITRTNGNYAARLKMTQH